ncbi:MAG: fatty acid CoA ligase family protein [Thermoanaerobaculales bacterium]|jgi:acyl-CoA synthetase (AMP-forming)/AMP-acid ligase II|nr:fatty acid CoA ligase family protein [Thermoanaerobaculales bacterium]
MGERVNIATSVSEMAQRQPAATAVICPWGRRGGTLTYAELDQRTAHVAAGLEAYGIGRGVRTVLMVPPGLELFVLAFGLFRAGAVPVLVDPGIGLKHLKACLGNARPEAFIGVTRAHAARVVLGWARATVTTKVTVGPRLFWGGRALGAIEAAGRTVGGRGIADTRADEVAAIVFTSGSTGPPKGVVYRHGNFETQIEAVRGVLDCGPGDIDLPTFPLFSLFDPALGMTTVIPEMDPTRPARVDPEKIIGPIREYGITTMFGSPALLDTVGRYGVEHGVSLPTLRQVVSAGAPVAPRIIERFVSLMAPGGRLLTPYGATESLPVAVTSSREILAETRHATDRGEGTCVGKPVPSIEAAIIAIDDGPVAQWSDDLRLPAGEVGEIVVKGGQVTREYFNAERHNRLGKIVDGDGVRHRMGDVGRFDGQGRLWFYGRMSQRVVAGGETFFSVPCEGVFNTHAEVFRSALVAAELNGETVPVICIEAEPGVASKDHPRIRSELVDLAGSFDHTKAIETVLFHPSFPVDIRHNAKIGRRALGEWATSQLRRSACRRW